MSLDDILTTNLKYAFGYTEPMKAPGLFPYLRSTNVIRLHRQGVFHYVVELVFLSLLPLAGCAKLDHTDHMPWSKSKKPTIPAKILPIWSDTVLHQKGAPGVRGFGGRVLFYDERDDEPIKVDGSLIVYAFDAEVHDPSNSKPEKQFVITADQLDQHYSRSKLGHSYSIWLPWDVVGGPSRQISLVVKFEGREGGVAISESATKLLPGVFPGKRQNALAMSEGGTRKENYVRQTSYGQAEDARATEVAVDTIEVPPSFTRHLRSTRELPQSKPTYVAGSGLMEIRPNQAPIQADSGSSQEPPRRTEPSGPMLNSQDGPRSAVRSESTLPPDQTARFDELGPDPTRKEPHPAKWPSALPPTPRSSHRGIVPRIRKAGESMFRKLR